MREVESRSTENKTRQLRVDRFSRLVVCISQSFGRQFREADRDKAPRLSMCVDRTWWGKGLTARLRWHCTCWGWRQNRNICFDRFIAAAAARAHSRHTHVVDRENVSVNDAVPGHDALRPGRPPWHHAWACRNVSSSFSGYPPSLRTMQPLCVAVIIPVSNWSSSCCCRCCRSTLLVRRTVVANCYWW